jgi:carboxylesterase type B
MPMTREHQIELRKMLDGTRDNYQAFKRRAEKEMPPTAAEKTASRLLTCMRKRRERVAQKYSRQFAKLKDAARTAVFFGDDTKDALRKIEAARKFCS